MGRTLNTFKQKACYGLSLTFELPDGSDFLYFVPRGTHHVEIADRFLNEETHTLARIGLVDDLSHLKISDFTWYRVKDLVVYQLNYTSIPSKIVFEELKIIASISTPSHELVLETLKGL